MLMAVFLLAAIGTVAEAAPAIVPITGEIERITLNEPANVYSGGVIVVGGVEVILPKNLLIDLPANRLSLQQIYAQAPAACVANGESGLAKADRCNGTGTGGFASISANRTNAGNVIAGDVFIQKGTEALSGVVSYINYDQGYYRLNGLPNSPTTGVMVRLNDPTSRHTIQSGPGCAGGPNCSPDPRFTLDPDNYTNTFSTGYPVCIPSTVARAFPGLAGVPAGTAQASASGTGDLLCPDTNRGTPDPVTGLEPPVADSRRFAPVKVGDSVTAEGNFETIGGVRFLSAHTTNVLKALRTQNVAGQPDYLFLEEVFIEAPAFQNQRARAMWIGFTTLAPTDVDIWSIHRDPVNNATHEFPLASVQGCDNAAGAGTCAGTGLINAGLNIFRIRYDVDFLMANPANPGFVPGGADPKLSPCNHLMSSRFATSNPGICPGGVTFANNMGIMSPTPHEIIARTGRKITSAPGSLITIDVNGASATNGEYLFPLGLNLGGIEVAEFNEIDLNKLNTPLIFEGIPWNLDRRLSPSGCLNSAGVPGPCPAGAMGTFALDPFPFSGLDPRTQADFAVVGLGTGGLPTGSYNDPVFTASSLTSVRNRIFSYVDGTIGRPNGNATVLPYALGTFPADPGLIPINPTPALSIFPPIADEDAATTSIGVSKTVDVLLNDFPVFGTIEPLSVKVATSPGHGTAVVNLPAGTITYSPAANFSGVDTFTYTVANNFGSVSLPGTVTVTVLAPPAAVNDNFSVSADSSIPIIVVANDVAGTSSLNLASVNIVSPPAAGCGTVVNQLNGTVLFNAPATVPAAPSTCTFSYTVSDISTPPLLSNVATVTVLITPPAAPSAPINMSPAGPGIATSAPFFFTAVAGATSYKIYYENLSGVGSFIDVTPAQAACASGTGACSFTPATPFAASTTYGWLVSAQNAAGPGPWSATLSFITAPATPAAPTAISPTGPGIATNAPFTFSAVAGATGYIIYSENLSGVGGFVSVSASQAGCPTGTGTCSYTPATPFTAATTYGWLVAAQNLSVQGPFSATLNFTTQ
jgi:hypothetical protein